MGVPSICIFSTKSVKFKLSLCYSVLSSIYITSFYFYECAPLILQQRSKTADRVFYKYGNIIVHQPALTSSIFFREKDRSRFIPAKQSSGSKFSLRSESRAAKKNRFIGKGARTAARNAPSYQRPITEQIVDWRELSSEASYYWH